jgi:transposase
MAEPRVAANSAFDFVESLRHFVHRGALRAGDILILDNARVHDSLAIQADLADLEAGGVRIVFLPAYSPELNPCELVFGQADNYMRNYRRGPGNFMHHLANAFAKVCQRNVLNYYKHCLRGNSLKALLT